MQTETRSRRRTRAEIARAYRNTTAGIVRDYLTVHFGLEHAITHEAHGCGETFLVRNRADRRAVHALIVDFVVLDTYRGRLYKLADLLAYLQVAHHLRKGGDAPLQINGRRELCEVHTGRALALPPPHGRVVRGREPVAFARTA